MRAAKTAATMKPGDTVKAAEALLAKQAALAARAELEAQDARAHAVKERVRVVRSSRRARRQAKASAPRSARTSVRAALAPPVQNMPTPQPAPLAAAAKPAKSLSAASVVAAPTSAPRNGIHRDSVASAPAPIVCVLPTPPTKKSPKKFAAPASTAPRESVLTRTPVTDATTTPALGRKPTSVFRTTQATKAARIAAAPSAPASQECPNCMAKVPIRTKRCRCGYELPLSASQIPSLTMSPEDRAAFLAALSPSQTDRDR